MPGDSETNTETQTPQVAPGAGLPMAATPEGAGVGVAAAVGQAAMVGVRVQHDEQAAAQQAEDHRNQVLALAGSTDMESYDINGLHGKGGLFTQDPGSNAQKLGDDYLQKRAQQAAKVRQGLPPAAQEAFDLHERQRALQTQQQVYEWQDRADKAFDQKVVSANLQNTANRALMAVNEPDPTKRSYAVNQSLAEGSMAIIDQAKRQGLDFSKADDAQVIQQRLDTFTSSIVGEVVSGLVDRGDSQGARAFYEEHAADLTGEDSARTQKILRAGEIQDEGLAIARFIIHDRKSSPDDPASSVPLNHEEAIAALDARGITSAKLYDEARRQIDTHFNEERKNHAEAQGDLLQQGTNVLDDPSNTSFSIPPSVLNGLDLHNRRALEAYQKSKVRDAEPKTDPDVWKSITDRLRDPDLMKAATMPGNPLYVDLNAHKADLSPQDFKHLASEFDTTKAKVAAGDQRLSAGVVQKEITDELFAQHGLDQKVKPGSASEQAQAQQQAAFSYQLSRAVGARQLAEQRPLKKGEIQEEADKLFTSQTWQVPPRGLASFGNFTGLNELVGGHGSKSAPFTSSESGPAYQAPWAKDEVYDETQIPAAMLQSMIKSEQKAGITKTGKARVQQYNDMIRARYDASLNTP